MLSLQHSKFLFLLILLINFLKWNLTLYISTVTKQNNMYKEKRYTFLSVQQKQSDLWKSIRKMLSMSNFLEILKIGMSDIINYFCENNGSSKKYLH